MDTSMTIGQLIDSLQFAVSSKLVTKDDLAYVVTPNGRDELAGVDTFYDAMPGEPSLGLFVRTED